MPSQPHEALLLLFSNRPTLAPELLRNVLQMPLPDYSEVRVAAADFSDFKPTEYRADMVVVLPRQDEAVLGIIIEVQLSRDERKRFAWPVYATTLRARLECPVCLLVVAGDDAVARWAAKRIDIGGGFHLAPWVLAPDGIPEIVDIAQARADPELAVLSAMAHGKAADTGESIQIALTARLASCGLDEDKAKLYVDLIMASLSEAARRELQTMDLSTYEYQYQSGFARTIEEHGRNKGEIAGRVAIVGRLLALRFGSISDEVRARLAEASIAELEEIGERLLTATTIQEALGSH